MATSTHPIITTTANQEMAELHDRMPLVLNPAACPLWLGEAEGDPRVLLRPAPDGPLKAWPVSTRVNSPRNDDAGLIEPERQAATGGGRNPEQSPEGDLSF